MYYHKAVHTNVDDNTTVCNRLEKISLHPCMISRYVHVFIVSPGILLRDKGMNRILKLYSFCYVTRASRGVCFS